VDAEDIKRKRQTVQGENEFAEEKMDKSGEKWIKVKR